MAKIPFDIKYRHQIESGEYKVCINYDWPVEILSWDCIHVNRKGKHFPILAKITCLNPGEENDFIHWYNNEGKYDPWDCISSAIQDNDCIAYCPGHDLFIVTPEEDLTEFENKVADVIDLWHEDYEQWSKPGASAHNYPDQIKPDAAELLALARKELFANDSVLKEYAQVSREQGKAEALKEFEEKYKQSWFNEGKIAGRFEGLTEDKKYQQGVHDGKEKALKDLPRWKPAAAAYDGDRLPRIDWFLNRLVAKFEEGIFYLNIADLYKLPGLKED